MNRYVFITKNADGQYQVGLKVDNQLFIFLRSYNEKTAIETQKQMQCALKKMVKEQAK